MKTKHIDLEELKVLINLGLSKNEIAKKLSIHSTTVHKAFLRHGLKSKHIVKFSEEVRKKMSDAKKLWLKVNPDKHNWRKKDKFKSVPCGKLKDWLKSKNIEFIEEYQPNVGDRHFSIDIAFPDKMIAIEVNGNFHYENEGKLKPYYQERHDILERNGWKVYEFHFSMCFHLDKVELIMPEILGSDKKVEFDYKIYVKPVVSHLDQCPTCEGLKHKEAKTCQKCNHRERKYIPVSKEYLEKAILEKPMSHIAKELDMSDNGVKKWCIRLGIVIPKMQGYWNRRKAGLSHEEALKPVIKKVSGPDLRLKEDIVISIKNDLNNNMRVRDVMKKYNVSKIQTINIKFNRSFKEILDKMVLPARLELAT